MNIIEKITKENLSFAPEVTHWYADGYRIDIWNSQSYRTHSTSFQNSIVVIYYL